MSAGAPRAHAGAWCARVRARGRAARAWACPLTNFKEKPNSSSSSIVVLVVVVVVVEVVVVVVVVAVVVVVLLLLIKKND